MREIIMIDSNSNTIHYFQPYLIFTIVSLILLQFNKQNAYQERNELLGLGQSIPLPSDHSTILINDHYTNEGDVLNSSHTRVDEFIQLGRNALTELMEQKYILKVHSKNKPIPLSSSSFPFSMTSIPFT